MKMIRWQIEILKIFNWIQLNRLRKDEANMQKNLKYFEEACTLERKISFCLEIHTENNSHSYASFALVILFVFDKLGEIISIKPETKLNLKQSSVFLTELSLFRRQTNIIWATRGLKKEKNEKKLRLPSELSGNKRFPQSG